MKQTKLSPNVKLGCSKCGGLELDIDNSNIILKERESLVTSVIRVPKKKVSKKTVSLF